MSKRNALLEQSDDEDALPSPSVKRKKGSAEHKEFTISRRSHKRKTTEWSKDDVGAWLQSIGYPQYQEQFASNDIDGSTLLKLDKGDIADMGVKSIGHRANIHYAVRKLQGSVLEPPTKPSSSSSSNFLQVPHQASSPKILRVAIEGNIAAGKSTFLKLLRKGNRNHGDYILVPEPISKWQHVASPEDSVSSSQVAGGNLLQMFYGDIKRWGFTFQTYAVISRMRSQLRPLSYFMQSQQSPIKPRAGQQSGIKVQFFERSVYTDRYCFAQNLYESGNFTEVEWNAYQDTHSFLVKSLGVPQLDGFVYIRTTPNVCLQRCKHRGRFEESNISIDYFQSLHDKHESLLVDYEHDDPIAVDLRGIPKLIIDNDVDINDHPQRWSELQGRIEAFINKLSS